MARGMARGRGWFEDPAKCQPAKAGASVKSGVGVSNSSRTCPFTGLAPSYSFPLRWKNRGYETLDF